VFHKHGQITCSVFVFLQAPEQSDTSHHITSHSSV